MRQNLLLEIDPIALAQKEENLAGQIPLSGMKRLSEILSQTQGVAKVNLKFQKDAEGRPVIQGKIELSAEMLCQRCNEPVEYPLSISVSLSPITHEKQAAQLPSRYEPLVTHGERVALIELVEDEIILNLPMIPKHEEENCPVELPENLR
jgi:uncharacterized protein